MDYAQKPPRAAASIAAAADHADMAAPVMGGSSHLVQMAEDLNASPAVARLETLQRAASAGNGLPAPLKAGVEALSGLSLDGVRVHRNSSRPAQLQAHAMTEGTDIHMAPGQERHLPHEAWHVVQQMQGRVRPTAQLRPAGGSGATPVNDDPALEAEADRMGGQALSLGRSGSLRRAGGHAASAAARIARPFVQMMPAVVQRMAVQIVLDDTQRVSVLHIVGRPPKAHGSSMGDHLTAFTVQQRGLKRSIENRDFWGALEGLTTWMEFVKELPGFQLIGTMPADKMALLQEAIKTQDELRAELPFKDRDGWLPGTSATPYQWSVFQKLVTAALEVLERLPLSTINVAHKFPSGAGKGKGESETAKILSTFEDNKENFNQLLENDHRDEIANIISSMFDFNAASMPMFENNNESMAKIAPGLTIDKNEKQIMEMMMNHHFASMKNSYPSLMEYVGNEKYLDSMFGKFIVEIDKYTQKLVGLENLNLQNIAGYANSLNVDAGLHIAKNSFNDSSDFKERYDSYKISFDDEKAYIASIQQKRVNLGLDPVEMTPVSFPALVTRASIMGEVRQKRTIKKVLRAQEIDIDKNKKPKLAERKAKEQREIKKKNKEKLMKIIQKNLGKIKGLDLDEDSMNVDESKGDLEEEVFQIITDKDHVNVDKDVENKDGDIAEEKDTVIGDKIVKEVVPGFAAQIEMADNGTIKDIIFDGRPPSPLRSGMGAHTTAWFVLQDWVRQALKGKHLPEAWEAIKILSNKAKEHFDVLSQHFVPAAGMSENKEDGHEINNMTKNIFSGMGNDNLFEINTKHSENNLKNIFGLTDKGGHHSMTRLQSMIVHLLNYMNSTPGATLPAVNTNNHGEQTARAELLDNTTLAATAAAIKSSFDINGLSKLDQVGGGIGLHPGGLNGMDEKAPSELMVKGDYGQAKQALWGVHLDMIKETYPHINQLTYDLLNS